MPIELPNTYIKPSPIHGLGLFAGRTIEKGEPVEQGEPDFDIARDEWITYNRTCKIKSFALLSGYCVINHSATPNTVRDEQLAVIALKTINKGEEITEDYNALLDNHNPFKNTPLEKIFFDYKYNQHSI